MTCPYCNENHTGIGNTKCPQYNIASKFGFVFSKPSKPVEKCHVCKENIVNDIFYHQKNYVFCSPICNMEWINSIKEQEEKKRKEESEANEAKEKKQIITEKSKCEDCKVYFENAIDWKKKTNSELEKTLSPKCNKKRRIFKRILWKNSQKRKIEELKKEWWNMLASIRNDVVLCHSCKEEFEEKHKQKGISYSEIHNALHGNSLYHAVCKDCFRNMEEIKGSDLLSYQVQPPK
jgi:hypothetical protein